MKKRKTLISLINFVAAAIAALSCITFSACFDISGGAQDGEEQTSATEDKEEQTSATEDKEEQTPATEDKEEQPPEKEERPLLGVWWWKDSLGDEYLNFAQDNGVTEIYYCSSKFNEQTDLFIQKAAERNMDVYWLAGEYEWVENPNGCKNKLNKYLVYQQSYTHKFKGVHFDIEPHQHPEFKSRRSELILKFISLTKTLSTEYPDIWIEYDIPFWLEDEITFNGVTKPAFQHIIDNASRVTLMSYRDTAEKIYSVSEAELNYAKSVGKSINLGVETKSNEGDKVSFMEEGKQIMYEEIAKLRKKLPDGCGVVIHQIAQWYDLKD